MESVSAQTPILTGSLGCGVGVAVGGFVVVDDEGGVNEEVGVAEEVGVDEVGAAEFV